MFHFSGEEGFVELERVKGKEKKDDIIYSGVDMQHSDVGHLKKDWNWRLYEQSSNP